MEKSSAIVYIITKLELGGAQKVCLSLFKNIQKNGFTTYLISGTEGTLVNQISDLPNVFLLKTMKREINGYAIVQEIKNFFAITRILRSIKKNHSSVVVHTHSTKAGIVGRWAAWLAGIPARIHTIHGFSFHEHQPKLTQLTHTTIEWATSLITTRYVCVSNVDAQTATKFIPNFSKKQIIIRAAVDEQPFLAARTIKKIENDSFIIGTVACFKPQKNLLDLLQAFKLAYTKNNKLRLEIIGDGAQRSEIESWINQHNLKSVITLHGWQKNVATFMSNWNLFVLSSLWEGLPCAVVEARLVGLPVVAYATGGIPEVILSGINGMLVQKKEWRSLAESLVLLSTNSTIYNKMCTHKENLDEFTQTNMIAHHKKLYQNTIKIVPPFLICIALQSGMLSAAEPKKQCINIKNGFVQPLPIKQKVPTPFSGPSGKQQQAFESLQSLSSLFDNVNHIMEAAKQT